MYRSRGCGCNNCIDVLITSPSTTTTSANLFNNMKTAPILDSYSESSYATTHGDICTNITPTPTYVEMPQVLMRTSIQLLHPQPLLLYILDQLLELVHAN